MVASQVQHVSITIVRARVVGKRKRSTAAAWRYGRCLRRAARHHRGAREDEPGPSKGAGERKAHAQVGDDNIVAFLHLHGSRPVGGEYGTEVEWRYSYQVIPPGGAATDTAG